MKVTDGNVIFAERFCKRCLASDDFGHALGDPEEASLAVALHLLATGQCLPDPAAEEAQADPLGGLRATPVPMGGDPMPTFALLR